MAHILTHCDRGHLLVPSQHLAPFWSSPHSTSSLRDGHSSNKYLPRAHTVLGTVLGAEDTFLYKTVKVPALRSPHFSWREERQRTK